MAARVLDFGVEQTSANSTFSLVVLPGGGCGSAPGGRATVTPVGLDHTSGVPDPGNFGQNTWSLDSAG